LQSSLNRGEQNDCTGGTAEGAVWLCRDREKRHMKRTVSRLFAGLLSAAIIFSGTAGPVSAREQIGIIWQMPEEPEESEDTSEAGMPKETDRIPEDENREESGGTPGAGA